MRAFTIGLSFASLSFALAASAAAQDAATMAEASYVTAGSTELRVETVASGLNHPWAVAPLPDGRLLVTERNSGALRIVNATGEISAPLTGMPEIFRFEGVTSMSQGGLFDVLLHPDFERNRQIYVSFSKPTERGAAVAVIRGTLAAGGLENVSEIFVMKPEDQDSGGLHFGGRMALAADREHIFLSIGDRRNMSRAQDFGDQAGAILRMRLDGTPSAQNPQSFPKAASGEDQSDDEPGAPDQYMFAVGSRNSQALAIEPSSGELWSAEHGPQGGDRLDRVAAGSNLGWPFYTTGKDYSDAKVGAEQPPAGMQAPTHAFAETVAPSGATFYNSGLISNWQGSLLIGGLANKSLVRATISNGAVGAVETIEIGRRVRDVQVGPDGAVWMVTDEEDGALLRITPSTR